LVCGRVLAVEPFGVTSCPSGEKSRAIDSTSASFQAASIFSPTSGAPHRLANYPQKDWPFFSALPVRAIIKNEKLIETHKAVNDGLAIRKNILKLLTLAA
jgi:hypothetical protein